MVNKKLGSAEITESGSSLAGPPISILHNDEDMVRLEAKIDEMSVKLDKMIDSLRIFKLNFQQTNMMRK